MSTKQAAIKQVINETPQIKQGEIAPQVKRGEVAQQIKYGEVKPQVKQAASRENPYQRFREGERNKLFAVPISEKFFEGEQNKLFTTPSHIAHTPEEWQMIKHPESLRKPQIPEDIKFKENKLKKEAERLQKKETARTQKQQASNGFYTEIGYPQYEGKYEPFEIPKGKNILKIVKSKKGLEVYWRPTKEEINAAYAQSNELYKSNKFYASIGYPEYGGKYAPFTIPEGYQIESITRTKQGLNISFILAPKPSYDEFGFILPVAGHFGPPSGYSSVPVNLDELVQAGKVTVSKLLNTGGGGVSFEAPTIAGYAELEEKYAGTSWVFAGQKASVTPAVKDRRGAEYTAGLEKQFSEKGLFDLIDVPAGYRVVGAEDVSIGPLGSELYPELAPLSKAKVFTLEKQAATVAPSGMEQLSKSSNPIVGGFAKNIVGAEQIKTDPTKYILTKVLEIGGTVAALVNPLIAITGAGISTGISQGIKAAQGGGFLTLEEAKISAFSGALFSAASVGAAGAIGKAVSTTGIIGSQISSATARMLAGVGLRAVSNAALGGGVGYLASGGDVEAAKLGALIGGGLSLGADVAKFSASLIEARYHVSQRIPVLKYGSVDVPLEGVADSRVQWRGLYVQQGEKILASWGKWNLENAYGQTMGKWTGATSLLSSILGQSLPIEKFAALPAPIADSNVIPPGSGGSIVPIRLNQTPVSFPMSQLFSPSFLKVKSTGLTGEAEGYRPQTAIEAEVTRQYMGKAGTPPEEIAINKLVVETTVIAKGGGTPKLFEEMLPKQTKTSTVQEVTGIKDVILKNTGQVEKVFGKFSAIPQENPEYEYTILDKKGSLVSSVRLTGDIDILLKSGLSKKQVLAFTEEVKGVYEGLGVPVRVSPSSTLIETIPVELRGVKDAPFAHAVDIHSDYDELLNPTQQGTEKAWGITIPEKPRLIEKIPSASLKEQIGGKLQSILDITREGTFMPKTHRIKDIPDFMMDARTLIEQRGRAGAKGLANLEKIAAHYGVMDVMKQPIGEVFEEFIPASSKSQGSGKKRASLFSSAWYSSLFSSLGYPSSSSTYILSHSFMSAYSSASPKYPSFGKRYSGYPSLGYPSPKKYPSSIYPSLMYSSPMYPSLGYPSQTYPSSKPSSTYPSLRYPSPTFPSPIYPSPKYPVPTYSVPTTPKPTYPLPTYPLPTYPSPSLPKYPASTYSVPTTPKPTYPSLYPSPSPSPSPPPPPPSTSTPPSQPKPLYDFDKPLGKSLYKELFRGAGRYKRQYPIMTGKQMLREVLKR